MNDRQHTSDEKLTASQCEFLRKIRASKTEIRFNLRGKRPLTVLETRGLITLRMEGEACSKRGLRFYYVAAVK